MSDYVFEKLSTHTIKAYREILNKIKKNSSFAE